MAPRKSTAPRKKRPSESGELIEITRGIDPAVKCLLWARAAGRCEFRGCNQLLYRSSVTLEAVSIAELAHIYAFSSRGPRGNVGIPPSKLNQIGNLILVCPECHKVIDDPATRHRYTVPLVQGWKADHERRVELVTGIQPSLKSHMLLYEANVGDHRLSIDPGEAMEAMFPDAFPIDSEPIRLGTVNGVLSDREGAYWEAEARQLGRRFEQRVRTGIEDGRIRHVSVFAFAPQPLLILLGTLLSDIHTAEVYQLHREPRGWRWPTDPAPCPILVDRPIARGSRPVIVLALSATVAPNRIHAVLGQDVSIWTVRIDRPHNDFTKSRALLSDFRSVIRSLLDELKAIHGQSTPIHVFPATSISTAIEFGRARAPKADAPWIIYDQNNDLGGFSPALSLPTGVAL